MKEEKDRKVDKEGEDDNMKTEDGAVKSRNRITKMRNLCDGDVGFHCNSLSPSQIF